jgi:hypothetical protein
MKTFIHVISKVFISIVVIVLVCLVENMNVFIIDNIRIERKEQEGVSASILIHACQPSSLSV